MFRQHGQAVFADFGKTALDLDFFGHFAGKSYDFGAAKTGGSDFHIVFGANVQKARYDERTGYVMVLSALDNLAKGASGGAVQAANVALGLNELDGLSMVGMYP